MIRIIALLILFLPAIALATTPTISNVSGTVATGQTLTITGAFMQDEAKTGWDPFFVNNPNAWSFEGASPVADGYSAIGPNDGVYDTANKLIGSKSMKFTVAGQSTNLFDQHADYNAINPAGGDANEFWVRAYVRWNLVSGGWPSSHIKMIDIQGTNPQYYFQPDNSATGVLPSKFNATHDSTSHRFNNPSGQIQNNRWYGIEIHWKTNSTPYIYDVWIDGALAYSANPVAQGGMNLLLFGVINACCTASNFVLQHWFDGFAVATSRVYLSSTVEIANSANYAAATKRYQVPTFISNTSTQITADLTGLGAGPYYLFVTNNKQERSAAFQLTGGSDTEAPTTPGTPGLTVTSNTSIDVTWTASTDNTAVTHYELERCEGVSCSGFAQIATPASNSYSDTGLTPSTSYSYRARASDAAANLSSYSGTGTDVTTGASNSAPVLTEVKAAPTPTRWTLNDVTVGVADADGDPTYTLNCAGGCGCDPTVLSGAGNHIVNLSVAGDGTYGSCTITANDGQADSNTLALTSFDVDQTPAPVTLLTEGFNDTDMSGRGWYDNGGGNIVIDATDPQEGAGSYRCTFANAASVCTGGYRERHLFTASDAIYLTYYTKYSANWIGSGQNVHPHLILFLTDENGDFDGLAYSRLSLYAETNAGTVRIASTDGMNIDNNQIDVDLTEVTELRAVSGCNGEAINQGAVFDCFVIDTVPDPDVHNNGRFWDAPSPSFTTSCPGPTCQTDWKKIELYIRLNNVVGGIGQANGVMGVWVDGIQTAYVQTVIFRTGQHPDMKINQIIIAPFIGPPGSPVTDQSVYFDNLTLKSEIDNDTSVPVVTDAGPVENISRGQSAFSVFSVTNEPSTCRLGLTGAAWGSMTEMDGAGGTFHNINMAVAKAATGPLSVRPGRVYARSVICQDTAANEMSPIGVRMYVPPDTVGGFGP